MVGSGASILSPDVQQEHAGYEQQTHHKYWNRTPAHGGMEQNQDKLMDTGHTEAVQLLPVCFIATMVLEHTACFVCALEPQLCMVQGNINN